MTLGYGTQKRNEASAKELVYTTTCNTNYKFTG